MTSDPTDPLSRRGTETIPSVLLLPSPAVHQQEGQSLGAWSLSRFLPVNGQFPPATHALGGILALLIVTDA